MDLVFWKGTRHALKSLLSAIHVNSGRKGLNIAPSKFFFKGRRSAHGEEGDLASGPQRGHMAALALSEVKDLDDATCLPMAGLE